MFLAIPGFMVKQLPRLVMPGARHFKAIVLLKQEFQKQSFQKQAVALQL